MNNTIKIKVIPNAKKNSIIKFAGGLKVYLTASPEQGKANKMLIKVLAKYLNIKKSQICIIKGEKSRDKVVSFTI